MSTGKRLAGTVLIGGAVLLIAALACSSSEPSSDALGEAVAASEVAAPGLAPRSASPDKPESTAAASGGAQASPPSGPSSGNDSRAPEPAAPSGDATASGAQSTGSTSSDSADGSGEPSSEASTVIGPEDAESKPRRPELEIVEILDRDGIPAIFEPRFLGSSEGSSQMEDTEMVIGLEIDGDARAYSVPYLSRHEIVNDVVGGKPVAVTW